MAGIDQYTKLMLHMDGTLGSTVFLDSSPSAHAVVAQSNAQISTVQSKFGGASGAFDGTGAALSVASSTDFDLLTNDFTIDFWANMSYYETNPNQRYTYIQKGSSFGASGGHWGVNLFADFSGVDWQMYFRYNIAGSSNSAFLLGTFPKLNTWEHYAIVRSSSSLYCFRDGIQLGSIYNIGSDNILDYLTDVTIAKDVSSGNWFPGYIDELRISNGIARWTESGFTPPSEAYSVSTYPRTGPEKYRVVIRDRNFIQKEIIEDEFMNLQWSYSRIGGCGSCSFELPRKRFQERAISGEYNIMIYHRNPDTNQWDLWYQGLVENKIPKLTGNTETIPFQGHGYQTQLSRIYLNNLTFTNTEVSSIVAQIMGTYVEPYTDINFDPSLIATTEFTPSSITFNENALSAITKLADLVGQREWGVDLDRDFFFVKRSSEIGFRFLHGRNITAFEDNQDFTQIINQVYVQGAQVGGTYHFFGPYNSLNSQAKYGLRTEVIQNASITGSDVAEQFADSILVEKQEVSRRASCGLAGYVGLMESTVPMGLFMELDRGTTYGEKKYGTFLYGGIVGRVINRINYSVSANNALTIRLDLGQLRPSISEQISQVNYQIEQVSQAAL